MSRKQRLALLGLAVVVAAAAVVVVKPGGGGKDEDKASTAQRATHVAMTHEDTHGSTQASGHDASGDYVHLRVSGAPDMKSRKVSVSKGETVRLAVTPQVAGVVHVHGYNLGKAARKNQTVRFKFPADIEGVFEIELHTEAGAPKIADLEVRP